MILVTGATGTVGRQLILELKTRQAPFRVFARDPAKARALLGPVDAVAGDLARPETFGAALRGAEAAFLLSPMEPRLVAWETGLARAAAKAGVKRLVKLSALGADPRSPAAILRWHGQAEEEVRRAGAPFTFLRPGALYQNLLGHADSIRRGTLALPMGDARVAMVDARDVAACAAAALCGPARAGQTLTLTGPTALSYREVAAIFARVLGRPVSYAAAAPDDARRALDSSGTPPWMTDALLSLAERLRAGDSDVAADDVRAASGREPISLETFALDHRAAFA